MLGVKQVLLSSGFQSPIMADPGGMDAFPSPPQISWASANGSDRPMSLDIRIAPYCPQHQLEAFLSRNS